MPFAGIIFIVLSSLLIGTLITTVFRERNADYVVKFATGFLSLFVFLLFAVLVALKLDFDLNKLSLLYLGTVSVVSVVSLPVLLRQGIKKPEFSAKGYKNAYVILAAVIGFLSFIMLSQSFINDDTLEIVETSVSTNTVYKFSSLTGDEMINGLPIFNKVYVMPMFYACMRRTFGLNQIWMTEVNIPVLIYIFNLLLVGKIATKLSSLDKNRFMIFYLLLLVAGTYLPSFGIPVTAGYAILRQGYSGYAVVYGILMPLIVLNILDKNYLVSFLHLGFAIPLLKLDRVLYAVLDFSNSFEKYVSSGKLIALFLIALLAMWIMSGKDNKKADYSTVIMPMLFVSYVGCLLIEKLESKKEKVIYSVVIGLIALGCVNFQPFKGARTLPSYLAEYGAVSECVKSLRAEYSNLKIYGSADTMTFARICSDNTTVLYGRDFDNSYMLGMDYEEKSEYISDYDKLMKNIYRGFDYLVIDNAKEDIFAALREEGVNAIIIPPEANDERIAGEFETAGFMYKGPYGKYLVYGRF